MGVSSPIKSINSAIQVFVLGATNIDLKMTLSEYPKLGELKVANEFKVDAGGKANGQACAIAKLGVPTYFISCIGRMSQPNKTDEDLIDIEQLSQWKNLNLNTEFVTKLPGKTGVTLITVVGKSNVICEYMGNNEKITRNQIDNAFERAKSGDFFLSTYEAKDLVDYALEKAKRKKMITVLSPAPIPKKINRLDLVDYLVVYEQELREITGVDIEGGNNRENIKAAYNFLINSENSNKNLILIVCLGPNEESLYVKNFSIVFIPAPKVEIKDKTLCRGAFIGGFVSSATRGNDLEICLKYANSASAFCSMHIGSISALPSEKNVEETMRDYPSY